MARDPTDLSWKAQEGPSIDWPSIQSGERLTRRRRNESHVLKQFLSWGFPGAIRNSRDTTLPGNLWIVPLLDSAAKWLQEAESKLPTE